MVGGLMGGYPLGHFIHIPRCICMPAIAGISDGPSVNCEIHGARPDPSESSAQGGTK